MKKSGTSFLLVLVVVGVFVAFMFRKPGTGAEGDKGLPPPAFAEHLSLGAAQSRAGTKPVLAFATANWCPPCKEMKRTTLQDPRVTRWILDNTIPAYVDVDKDRAAAQTLSVTGIPAFVLLRDGKEVAKTVGLVGADEFLAWGADALERATPAR